MVFNTSHPFIATSLSGIFYRLSGIFRFKFENFKFLDGFCNSHSVIISNDVPIFRFQFEIYLIDVENKKKHIGINQSHVGIYCIRMNIYRNDFDIKENGMDIKKNKTLIYQNDFCIKHSIFL